MTKRTGKPVVISLMINRLSKEPNQNHFLIAQKFLIYVFNTHYQSLEYLETLICQTK